MNPSAMYSGQFEIRRLPLAGLPSSGGAVADGLLPLPLLLSEPQAARNDGPRTKAAAAAAPPPRKRRRLVQEDIGATIRVWLAITAPAFHETERDWVETAVRNRRAFL